MSQKTDTVVACTIGIDTGKNTPHLIGLDDRGAIVLREKLTRGRIAARLANVPQCLIGIEAGSRCHRFMPSRSVPPSRRRAGG
jgi:transposase